MPFHCAESSDQHALYQYLIRVMSAEVNRESRLLLVLGGMYSEQRLAHFLIDLSRRTQVYNRYGSELNLSMSRQHIASYVGLAVETVSRLFKRFEIDGIIRVNRRRIHIEDMERLYHILNGDYRFSMLRDTT